MKRRLFRTIFLSFVLIFIFSACKKNDENEIRGIWRRVNVTNIYSTEYEEWSFINGHVSVYNFYINPIQNSTKTGDYYIKVKHFKKILTLDVPGGYYSGDWNIKKLTNKYLIIDRQNPGLEYFEFTKQQ